MLPQLSPQEARIIGALIEKSIVTPDHYPLTLNALTTACNQKSARNPVTSFSTGEVQRLARGLAAKRMVRVDENFRSGVEKYTQIFCNTRYNSFKFDPAELALVCVLLLRGAQTPGELRTNCRRLHAFADNDAVVTSLDKLRQHPEGALVVKLPRTPGRRDAEYMHAFFGGADAPDEVPEATTAAPAPSVDSAAAAAALPTAATEDGGTDLEARVARLERELAELKARLGE